MNVMRRQLVRLARLQPTSVPKVAVWIGMRLIPGLLLGSALALAPLAEGFFFGGWQLVSIGVMSWIAFDVISCAKPVGGQCFYCFECDTWMVWAVPRWWRMLPSRWDARYVCDDHYRVWLRTHPDLQI